MRNLGRVLAATDFGAAADGAVAAAGAIAAAFGAELIVLHTEVFEVPPYFTRGQMALLDEQRRHARADATEHLRAAVARLTPQPFVPLVVEGAPADVILAHAGGAGLVAMGTHGHRGARRWWLGSVVERVLRETTQPLLVLHAGDVGRPEAVFARLQVMTSGAGAKAAVEWAAALAGRFGGSIEEEPPEGCTPAGIAEASLVVVAVSRDPSEARVTGESLTVLRSCPRPMLFVPASGAARDGAVTSAAVVG